MINWMIYKKNLSSTQISPHLIYQLPFIYWLLYVCVSMGVPLSMCRSVGTEYATQNPDKSWAYFSESVFGELDKGGSLYFIYQPVKPIQCVSCSLQRHSLSKNEMESNRGNHQMWAPDLYTYHSCKTKIFIQSKYSSKKTDSILNSFIYCHFIKEKISKAHAVTNWDWRASRRNM